MDNNELEILYLKHERNLRLYCLKLTQNNKDDAEDLVQEAFARFIARIRQEETRIADDKVGFYLGKIAKNAWYERFRKRINSNNTDELDSRISAAQLIDRFSVSDEIYFDELCRVGLGSLSELERKVTLLFYVEELKQKEIARVCSISVSYVKQILIRVRRRLRNIRTQLKGQQ